MTPAERVLWNQIRRNRIGTRFRRQYPTGPYVLDFVSLRKKIVIEVDGPWHDLSSPREMRREEFLVSRGFQVLHFSNDQVFFRLEQVIEEVVAVVGGFGSV